MKRLIAIFLFLLFMANEFSYFIVYLPMRNISNLIQQSKIESSLESGEYTVIYVKNIEDTNSDYYLSLLNESEFAYEGELYDVVKRIYADGGIYIYCIKDETEDLLNKSFNLHFSNKTIRNFSMRLFNITVSRKLIAFFTENRYNIPVVLTGVLISSNIKLFQKPFIEKISPPPKYL